MMDRLGKEQMEKFGETETKGMMDRWKKEGREKKNKRDDGQIEEGTDGEMRENNEERRMTQEWHNDDDNNDEVTKTLVSSIEEADRVAPWRRATDSHGYEDLHAVQPD